MTAGVPGLGLSGLFLMASIIVMPFLRRRPAEVRSTPRRGLFGLAAAIAVATWASWTLVAVGVGIGTGADGTRSASLGGTVAGMPAILVSLALVALLVAITEILARLLPHRPTPSEPPIVRLRTGGGAGVAGDRTIGSDPDPASGIRDAHG